jgi:hypothetical protein
VLKDDDAAKVADVIHNSLIDAATVYKTTVGPKHMDLHPGQVVTLPLDDTRTAKAVLTKMSGDTVLDMEFRKRGDSFTSEAVGQPTPYVIDTLLGPADVTPALIDGHLLRSADDNDGFYAGVAVVSPGSFRSATDLSFGGCRHHLCAMGRLHQRHDPRHRHRSRCRIGRIQRHGTARQCSPSRFRSARARQHQRGSAARQRDHQRFRGLQPSVGDWEYIRAASVVDNMNGTWTLSTLLRGLQGHRVRDARPCHRRHRLPSRRSGDDQGLRMAIARCRASMSRCRPRRCSIPPAPSPSPTMARGCAAGRRAGQRGA